jgi:hypothetical protein
MTAHSRATGLPDIAGDLLLLFYFLQPKKDNETGHGTWDAKFELALRKCEVQVEVAG